MESHKDYPPNSSEAVIIQAKYTVKHIFKKSKRRQKVSKEKEERKEKKKEKERENLEKILVITKGHTFKETYIKTKNRMKNR